MPRRMAFPAQISFRAVYRSWEKTLMAVFNVAGDARRTFDVLRRGGTAVVPHTIGYAAFMVVLVPGASPHLRSALVTIDPTRHTTVALSLIHI